MRLTTARRRALAAGVVLLLGLAVAAVAWRRRLVAVREVPARMPLPHRVTVEVRNTTRVQGIAGAVTLLLRHAGLDVLGFGSSDTARQENEILVRRGDTTGVGRVIEVLGHATVIDAPDPTPLVDLTVFVGAEYPGLKPRSRP